MWNYSESKRNKQPEVMKLRPWAAIWCWGEPVAFDPTVPRGPWALCQPGPGLRAPPCGEQHGTPESSPPSVTLSLSFPLHCLCPAASAMPCDPLEENRLCERRRGCWVFMEATATESLPTSPCSSVSVCVCERLSFTSLFAPLEAVSISGSSRASWAGETGNQQHEQHPLPVHLQGCLPLQRPLLRLSFIWGQPGCYQLASKPAC